MTADETAPGGERRRLGGLLWQRDFRLFWIGETVNQLGSAMALIGVPLLAVLFLHATTFERLRSVARSNTSPPRRFIPDYPAASRTRGSTSMYAISASRLNNTISTATTARQPSTTGASRSWTP